MFGAMSMEVKADITFDDEENSVNVDPVSYTHLDVYKRQLL